MEVKSETHSFTDGTGCRSEWEMAPPLPTDIFFLGYEGDAVALFGLYDSGSGTYVDDPVEGLAVMLGGAMRVYDNWVLPLTGEVNWAELELLGLEDVTVPAGTFHDCLKVAFSLVEEEEPYTDHLYFARDVGLVKAVRSWELMPTEGYFLLVNSTYPVAALQSATVGGVTYP